MTLAQISPRVTYVGNGATTVFSYTFEITGAVDLAVRRINISTLEKTVLVQDVDYSIDINTQEVTYPLIGSPLSSSYALELRREEEYDQPTSFSTQGAFDPNTLESALDYIVMQIQQVLDLVRGGTFSLPLPLYTVATLPSALTAAPALIYVRDASGGGIPCFSDGTNWRRVDDRTVVS